MDILVRTQATADIIIIVPMVLSTNIQDTGVAATLVVKAINPDGSENTSFTAPTVSEVISSSGVYKLIFPAAAANKLFTLANEYTPYTLVVSSPTTNQTGRKVIRCYCVDRLPGEYAKSTEIATLDAVVDTMATAANLATVDTVVDSILAGMATATALATVDTMVDTIYSAMATATALATVDTVVDTLTTNLATVDTVVDGIAANMATATNLATVDTVVDGIVTTLASVPTLAQIEASTVLAKAAATTFLTKCVKNKKKVKVISGVLYLIIYDDDNVTEILRKAIKDVDGTDVPDPAAGVIALETKSTV